MPGGGMPREFPAELCLEGRPGKRIEVRMSNPMPQSAEPGTSAPAGHVAEIRPGVDRLAGTDALGRRRPGCFSRKTGNLS